MTDLSKTPLTAQQIALLAQVKVPLYPCPDTGNTYVAKRYWQGINQALRDALVRAVQA